MVYSSFFNPIWKRKYDKDFPVFEGSEVKSISLEWLMFGTNDLESTMEMKVAEFKIWRAQAEQEFYSKEAALLSQLDMFIKKEEP